MKFDGDIIVAGGGLVGSIFALAAARENLKVVVFDAAIKKPSLRFNGRAYALSQSSCRLLRALNLKLPLQEGQDINAIRISDGIAGGSIDPLTLKFDSSEIGDSPMGIMVEDQHLRKSLNTEIKNNSALISIIPTGVESVSLEASSISVTDQTNNKYCSRMIAGCDGRSSIVAVAAGIKYADNDYQQSAIVCAVEHEKPHNSIAHQFFMPTGPLAILPLKRDRSSLVWTLDQPIANRLFALNNKEFLNELKRPFGNFLGEISLIGKRSMIPLTQSLADRLTYPRVALLGESAHGLHPLAGQGLNLGLRDAASLAEVLGIAARRGEDIGTVDILNRYQNWRRLDIAMFATATDGFNWIYSNTNPILRLIRGTGMMAIGRLPFIKQAIIREAAGLNGELPQIMSKRY